ncbi:AAA family ATPase [Corallococcus exiguus]|uniref:AAA family ATPase n=1 Tax=Corallococcus exiguus TaxID=83462 RepID=UPI0014713B0B|nr:AAA family ATPase [Corallococcus exiguus]NNB96739.1 AAA family ATPase [Corallococcus exiguus]NNC05466.1 AAA family ATPase [Corallococcus exiguus]
MLESIHLKNFKSFADAEVKLAPVTVLVGANASGKSNLLDALRLVQRLELGWTLTEALQGRREAGREVAPALRGGSMGLARSADALVELTLRWSLGAESLTHGMGIEVRGEPSFRWERVKLPDPLSGVVESKPIKGLPLYSELIEKVSEAGPLGEQVITRHIPMDASESVHPDAMRQFFITHPSGPVLRTLKDALFLEVVPARMRGYSPQQDIEIGAEGENISSVLWALSHRHPDTQQEWVDWLAELCGPEIVGLDFSRTELGDVMLVLVEKDGTRTPARSLSDGTLRFLGTLVALRTVREGSIVILEEPETGLHPQRIHLLVEFLEAVARERQLQVILTTHSPQVLMALSPEALKSTVLCARSPEHPGTVLRRLGDLPHFEEVSKHSNIEHLFTTGWLERAL